MFEKGTTAWADGTNVLVDVTSQGYYRILLDHDFRPVITGDRAALARDIRRLCPDVTCVDMVKLEVSNGRGVYVRTEERGTLTDWENT